jgi:muconolactone delta-isomerase
MLFHVTMTHTADDCPGYNPDKMKDMVAASEKMEGLAKQWNVKVLFYVNGFPEHVAFALLEADSPLAVTQFVHGIPFKQDFKVTPVMHVQEVMAMMKAAMAQG